MTVLFFPWPLGQSRPKPVDDPSSDTSSNGSDSPPRRGSLRRQPSYSCAQLLRHYAEPGACPPSSRIDLTIKQRESPPFSIWNLWKIGAAATHKLAEVTNEVVRHTVYGPRRPTWPIEMTIIAAFMRNASQHTHLADIATMRMLLGLGGLVPLPADALVTPVTFRVRRRKLRGMLAEFDALENGRRELQGEWVVGKKLWRRLQKEWQARKEGRMTHTESGRVVLFLHGGAYYCFSAATHRLLTIPLSKYTDARVFAVDYRLAPETRFPGPLHDAVSAYFRLVDDLKIAPENIVLAGDSAGGGLCLALLMYLRDNDYPLPSGGILMSPWVDLTCSCDSWESNAEFDLVPSPTPGDALNPINCYLGEHMEKYITHPYASPLFGNFKGLPPLLIQAGEAEVLRDEITLLAHKASSAGVRVQHELYEDAVHVFQALPFLEAAPRAFVSARKFVKQVLHSPGAAATPSEALERDADNEYTRVVRGDGADATNRTKADLERSSSSSSSDGSPERSDRSDEDEEDRMSWRVGPTTAIHSPPDSSDSEEEVEGRKSGFLSGQHTPAALGKFQTLGAPDSFAALRRALGASPSPGPSTRRPSPVPSRAGTWRGRSRTGTVSSSSGPTTDGGLTAPKPGIRLDRSNVDISTLVAQWEAEGPANETTTFTHEGKRRTGPMFFTT